MNWRKQPAAGDPHHRGDDMADMSGGGGHAMGHGRHGLMMIACCIPMLIIAVVLVATGVIGFGFIVVALACTAMMALMMRGMGGMGHGGD